MPRSEITITTRDGACPTSVFTPSAGTGPWPGVVFCMDGPGIRPTLWDMGQHLADAGYVVMMPDLFYRTGPYAPMVPTEVFGDPEKRAAMMQIIGSLDRDKKIADVSAVVDVLAARPDVRGPRFGITGYCMGGNVSLTAAGALKDRFAAIASFHGGGLTTESPDSPHLYLNGVAGEVYIAGAIEDRSFDDEQKARLEAALTVAGVDHCVETYDGAHHGFAVPDIPAYDAAAAERHWNATFTLFADQLG